MIKKLFYFIIPLIFISFSQNVKASDTYSVTAKNGVTYSNLTSDKVVIFQNGTRYANIVYFNSDIKYICDDATTPTGNHTLYYKKTTSSSCSSTLKVRDYKDTSHTNNWQVLNGSSSYSPLSWGSGKTWNDDLVQYSYYDIWNYNFTEIMYCGDVLTECKKSPVISYSLEPIYKDGYISSYGIKVNSTIVDDTLYKYQFAIKDNLNDTLKWTDLYNNNFINNEYSFITKKPIYFYFRVLDKSNNNIIDTFNVSVNFNIVSPQYDIIFNQSKFYLNGTNIIDRIGLSITYKTSISGLKYQYQYVDDGSSLSDSNWVNTENDIYKVYNVNGVLYARILDNNNNVLYSSSFTNTLIGKQDILVNPDNFPLYNKVQKVLNFNNGSISDLVLIPVKVLMFMSDSLNNNVCTDYSFGSLLGHEIKLPCIDIKSLVGETIYNFYDLVCSFFISLGIIRLLKNIYMRFMTLDIRDIDRNGGIF